MLRADILIYFKKCPKATYKKINCVKLRKCLKSSCCIGWCWCVGSIQYPPVSSLEMLERRTWVVAGRYFAGYYSGGLGTLPSPATGGREGRRDILKSLPACQGFSFTSRQTQYSGERRMMGVVGSQEILLGESWTCCFSVWGRVSYLSFLSVVWEK